MAILLCVCVVVVVIGVVVVVVLHLEQLLGLCSAPFSPAPMKKILVVVFVALTM